MVSLFPGNVPSYEEHTARIEAGYTIPQWYGLDYMDRALEVAHYRYRHLVEAVQVQKSIPKKGKK